MGVWVLQVWKRYLAQTKTPAYWARIYGKCPNIIYKYLNLCKKEKDNKFVINMEMWKFSNIPPSYKIWKWFEGTIRIVAVFHCDGYFIKACMCDKIIVIMSWPGTFVNGFLNIFFYSSNSSSFLIFDFFLLSGSFFCLWGPTYFCI